MLCCIWKQFYVTNTFCPLFVSGIKTNSDKWKLKLKQICPGVLNRCGWDENGNKETGLMKIVVWKLFPVSHYLVNISDINKVAYISCKLLLMLQKWKLYWRQQETVHYKNTLPFFVFNVAHLRNCVRAMAFESDVMKRWWKREITKPLTVQ
jgi:hypothetical protein